MHEDLWHLTIDDLLATPPAGHRLGEPGPYVITLSASSAPLSMPPKKMVKWDQLHVYQVQREEGGRRRYRLRLGPISSELEADAILASAREHYPAAFITTADKDDLRAIAVATSKVAAQPAPKSAAQVPREAVAKEVRAARQEGAPQGSERPVGPGVPVVTPVTNVRVPQASHRPVPVTSPPSAFRPIQRLLSTSRTSLSTPPTLSTPPLKAVGAPVNKEVPLTLGRAAPVTKDARSVPIERPSPPIELRPPPPDLDSTQTLRALTASDLAEGQLTKWFAIQLATGKEAFRPEDVLSLDLFEEFNLYSTIELDQGRHLHALRLGFFLDEAAAQVVADYLKGFFDTPTIKRVSASERERFAEGRVAARKTSDATGIHEVVELSSPAPAPKTTLADLSKVATWRAAEDLPLPPSPVSPRKR